MVKVFNVKPPSTNPKKFIPVKEKTMVNITKAYVTTGQTDTFFVLRVSGHYISKNGCYPRDRYVTNLGRNWETAVQKAKDYCKQQLPNTPLSIPTNEPKLQPLQKRNPKTKIDWDSFPMPF